MSNKGDLKAVSDHIMRRIARTYRGDVEGQSAFAAGLHFCAVITSGDGEASRIIKEALDSVIVDKSLLKGLHETSAEEYDKIMELYYGTIRPKKSNKEPKQ